VQKIKIQAQNRLEKYFLVVFIFKKVAGMPIRAILQNCAAKAFYSCPAIISRRLESQKTPKEPQLNPEEESKIIQARSHVTLEKSSRNYKPSEE
jgi:hypothetical protein